MKAYEAKQILPGIQIYHGRQHEEIVSQSHSTYKGSLRGEERIIIGFFDSPKSRKEKNLIASYNGPLTQAVHDLLNKIG